LCVVGGHGKRSPGALESSDVEPIGALDYQQH
jgi:hypothetical protein